MQVIGILVRTRSDALTEIGFRHAEEILQASRQRGHIFIDIAAHMATRENLLRIIDGIGSPSGSFLKLVVFYCHGNVNSPIDQNGEDFITEDAISRLAGWGVYCIGCNVGRTLGHRLLVAGAHFLIAFNANMMVFLPHADEIFAGLNVVILRMLREGIGPSAATEHMRQFFLESIDHVDQDVDQYAILRSMALLSHAEALVYHGPDIRRDLNKIKPGQKQAAEFQVLVAKILHEVFCPHLDEPHLEVSNESGSSRYDIVFMNRAEHGFWHDIKISRGNAIVIFDAKNKRKLEPSDADKMLRYSGPWRGEVLFLVCRYPPASSFTTRAADLLKEKGICLVVLSDQQLEEMHTLRQHGSDAAVVVERLYRERIERA
jgi:hypothetical protein